jgi:hypothetical protein
MPSRDGAEATGMGGAQRRPGAAGELDGGRAEPNGGGGESCSASRQGRTLAVRPVRRRMPAALSPLVTCSAAPGGRPAGSWARAVAWTRRTSSDQRAGADGLPGSW